ncbi:hypothetical protein KIL84_015491, partial [Mauremys mutica]
MVQLKNGGYEDIVIAINPELPEDHNIIRNIQVVEFCDQSTHNEKATNMQNKMCNYKSTWEVIMNSPDFSNSSPINSASPPFETSFSLLQTKDRVVCLVLDVSGSMDWVIKQKYSNLDGSEIVLLTDGEDRGMSSCLTEVKNSGSIIHTIALGPSAAPELEQFSDMT